MADDLDPAAVERATAAVVRSMSAFGRDMPTGTARFLAREALAAAGPPATPEHDAPTIRQAVRAIPAALAAVLANTAERLAPREPGPTLDAVGASPALREALTRLTLADVPADVLTDLAERWVDDGPPVTVGLEHAGPEVWQRNAVAVRRPADDDLAAAIRDQLPTTDTTTEDL